MVTALIDSARLWRRHHRKNRPKSKLKGLARGVTGGIHFVRWVFLQTVRLSIPSPMVLTTRPLCSSTFASINWRRCCSRRARSPPCPAPSVGCSRPHRPRGSQRASVRPDLRSRFPPTGELCTVRTRARPQISLPLPSPLFEHRRRPGSAGNHASLSVISAGQPSGRSPDADVRGDNYKIAQFILQTAGGWRMADGG